MKKLLLVALLLPSAASAQVWVNGPARSDGTYAPGRWLPTPTTPEMNAWISRQGGNTYPVRPTYRNPWRIEPPKPTEPQKSLCYLSCDSDEEGPE